MEIIKAQILALKPTSMLPVALFLALVGIVLIVWALNNQSKSRISARNRLSIKNSPNGSSAQSGHAHNGDDVSGKAFKATPLVSKKLIASASDFYTSTDPDDVVRIRQKLIRAGFMEPGAVGLYFLTRMCAGLLLLLLAFPAMMMFGPQVAFSKLLMVAGIAGLIGYFSPNIVLGRVMRHRIAEYRAGFPDFMDLMIVCADAGMSMEAAIERVSREIAPQYPALSQNLMMVTMELRAGRQLSEALKSLADRLGLDEVRSFATLLQQSKELGTSLSDTLRVFSDEMRHKRMSKAEEKAHALPAKMTVPVTMFILPVIMLIATIPAIVNMTQ